MPHFQSTKSVLFDGSTQYGTAGNVLGFEYNQPFTLLAWINTTSSSGTHSILSKLDNAPNSRGWDFYQSGGSVVFILSNIWGTQNILASSSGNPAVNSGAWRHVAVTYDGSADATTGVKFYVDGSLYSTNVLGNTLTTGTTVNTIAMEVGRRYQTANHQYFDGAIDEAAVYNTDLTADEIAWVFNAGWGNSLSHMNAPSNLVSWWRMGEFISAPTIPDQQSSNNLTLVGSPTVQDDGPVPDSAYSAEFVDVSYFGYDDFTPENEYASDFVDASYFDSADFVPQDVYTAGAVVFYKMRGRDNGVPAPGYVTWVVQGDPDFGGTFYPDGDPTPVGSMVPGSAVVVASWQE